MNEGPKLTPWFPASTSPVHEGVYEVHEDRWPWRAYAWWHKDCYWCTPRGDARLAAQSTQRYFPYDTFQWRGSAISPTGVYHESELCVTNETAEPASVRKVEEAIALLEQAIAQCKSGGQVVRE